MRKNFLAIIILIIISHYLLTFIISFTFLINSVVNNNYVKLEKYIHINALKKNFYNDIYKFSTNFFGSMNKNIKINNQSIEFTGKLTTTFLENLSYKMAENISTDFSNPKIILYFYFNSNEITEYLNNSLSHFGNYNFEKFLLKKNKENIKEIQRNEENITESKENIQKKEEKKINIISKLIKRIRSTNYFFLINPIEFMIDVEHQNIQFIVILKFNGLVWKVNKIKIPYSKLVNKKEINLGD